jgi:hypothetical protein
MSKATSAVVCVRLRLIYSHRAIRLPATTPASPEVEANGGQAHADVRRQAEIFVQSAKGAKKREDAGSVKNPRAAWVPDVITSGAMGSSCWPE